MFTDKERFCNTIAELEYHDRYDEFPELFDNSIELLKNRVRNENYDEFSEDELEILEKLYSKIF